MSTSRRKIPTLLSVLSLATTLAGCGGDSVTGLTEVTDLSGSWTYAAPNMTGTIQGFTVVCGFSNVPLTISQTGDTFTGSTNGGSFSCSIAGQSDGGVFGGRIIVNGEVDDIDVEFDFDGPDWHHSGTIDGNSMSGQVTAIIELSTGSVVLRGGWSAAR